MKVLITIVLIYLVICLLCFLNKCFQKLKLSPVRTLCASDDRLKGAKIFGNTIKTPIAINEAGYIGFVLRGSKFVFSIKDVNGFNVTIDICKTSIDLFYKLGFYSVKSPMNAFIC